MDNYKHKYLKYKTKYLKLLSQSGGTKQSKIIVKNPNLKQSFDQMINFLKSMDFFRKEKYDVPIPDNDKFKELSKHPEKIKDIDMKEYFQIFKNEIYKPIDLTYINSKLSDIILMFNNAINKLKKLNENWDFKLFSKYIIHPVFYSSGGSYWFTENRGYIYLKVNDKGKFNRISTIIHEIVHIGIEKNIVRKYNLTHPEKEHIVDIICSKYLKLPEYHVQEEYIIDELNLTYDNILNDFPNVIKKYKEKY